MYLTDEKLNADSFLEVVFAELSQLEEPWPGAVAWILQPLLLSHPVPTLALITNPVQVHVCSAEIIEPQPDSETIHNGWMWAFTSTRKYPTFLTRQLCGYELRTRTTPRTS